MHNVAKPAETSPIVYRTMQNEARPPGDQPQTTDETIQNAAKPAETTPKLSKTMQNEATPKVTHQHARMQGVSVVVWVDPRVREFELQFEFKFLLHFLSFLR